MEEGKHEIVKANLGPTSKSQSNKKEKVTNRRLKRYLYLKIFLGICGIKIQNGRSMMSCDVRILGVLR